HRVGGALLHSLGRARRFFTARGPARVKVVSAKASWHPEELLERALAQNASTWAALERLGVQEGSEIRLDFFFETGGPDADRELADFLRNATGHHVVVEADG